MYTPSVKTAMARKHVSAPLKRILHDAPGALWGDVCNWGAGNASCDTEAMWNDPSIYTVTEYEPSRDDMPVGSFDTIYCGYVLNTLPKEYRDQCVRDVLTHLRDHDASVAMFAVRADKIQGTPWQDGVMTAKNTFQKSFTATEFKDYLSQFGKADALHFGHYIIGMVINERELEW